MVSLNRRLLVTDQIPYDSGSENANNSSHAEESEFDVNMVVVLAALLCALVAALALNSIIHLVLRRRRDSMEAASNATTGGLEKQALRKIPVAVFRSRAGFPATECSICLGEFVDGEKVRVLPHCKHEFHVMCVDKWLVEHSSCPNCRRSLVSRKVGRATASVTMVYAL